MQKQQKFLKQNKILLKQNKIPFRFSTKSHSQSRQFTNPVCVLCKMLYINALQSLFGKSRCLIRLNSSVFRF